MKNATLSLKVLRINNNKELIFKTVDAVIEIIKESGLDYLVGPSETTVDGNVTNLMDLLNKVIDLIKECDDPIFISSQIYYQKRGITPLQEKIKGK